MPSIETLIELLRKISKSTDRLKIEANYDGREWTWKVTESNVTANEWMPKESKVDRKFPPRERTG